MGTHGGTVIDLSELGKDGDRFTKPDGDRYFSGYLLRTVALFTLATLACLILSNQGLNFWGSLSSLANDYNVSKAKEILELDGILKNAAMPDKTVILCPLNEAWIEPDSIFDLFLESFKIGNQTSDLVKHLVVVSLDQKAFDHCLGLQYLNCYLLKTEGADFSEEAHFMTANYLEIVWKKIDFLRIVLETGYNFLFTDADIMWLRNPFPRFYPDTDLQVACDYFNGNSSNLNNGPNTGVMYVKSSNRTVEFFKSWYKSREIYPNLHDQDAFNMIKFDLVKLTGLTMKFMNTAYFGGFCQPSRDLNLVCTMHANCCAGLDNKIYDLKILLENWKKYLSMDENMRESQPPSWTVPQKCGPPSFGPHTPRKRKSAGNDTRSKN